MITKFKTITVCSQNTGLPKSTKNRSFCFKLAISKKAHFVSSSYISPEMRNLNNAALKAEVSLVNEIGLDPGIDHLMAHKLMF